MFGSVIIFILVLSLLILVHELGHFLAARKAGILVEEFGFGLPPRVFGKKVGETIYSINLLPFGGFVRLHGENYEEDIINPKRAFLNSKLSTRTIIITAGVVMNFLLAIVAFAIVYSFTGVPRQTNEVMILEVSKDTPAEEAGILKDDHLISIQGVGVVSTDEFLQVLQENQGKEVVLSLIREGSKEELQYTLLVREDHPSDQGPLGIVISSSETYLPPWWQRPFVGTYYGFKEALFWGKMIVVGIATMIMNLFAGEVPKGVAGPIGIFVITSEAAKFGLLTLINFVGILSVNLAILNMIPFPAVDGGRLLFIALEAIFGKRVLPRVEAIVHTVGFVILMLLLLAITASDIKRLVVNGGISGFLDSFSQ